MATDVSLGFRLMTLAVLLLIHDSATQMMMLDSFSGVGQCDVMCTTAFADSKASNKKVCDRGCRLMSLIDLMAQRQSGSSLDGIKNACLKACKDSYADGESEGACAFGCQGQLPAVETRRKHLAAFYNEQMDEMSSWMGMHHYYSRMMQCIADQMEHQLRVSWYAYQSPGDDKLAVVLNAPRVGDGNKERDSAVEPKTSNYLETNLVPVDRAATSNLGMLESDSNAAAVAGTDRPVKMDADWLFCVRRRESVMRKILSLMVGISLIALIYFIISSALSASHVTQRASVSADSECLTEMDDKELLLKTEPQELFTAEAPLPLKMPVNRV